MGPMITNGVAVIAAGKKRSERNHALPDREFEEDQFWLAVKLACPRSQLLCSAARRCIDATERWFGLTCTARRIPGLHVVERYRLID